MRLIILLIHLFAFFGAVLPAYAQNKDFKQLLVGKRWGLSLFIQKNANVYDTIFRVRDCQGEYIEITGDNRFLSTDLNKEGSWKLNGDLLELRKSSGGKYKTLKIAYLSEDSLTLLDEGAKPTDDTFIETYKICGLDDNTFIDTREIKTIRKSWGITAGLQQFQNSYFHLGIANAKFEWNNVFYAAGAGIETSTWSGHYGLNVNFWSEDIAVYGAGLVAITDFNKVVPGFRPMLGISSARLTHYDDFTIHLAYSYTFLLGSFKDNNINRHAINLRFYVPFGGSTRKVRRIIKDGADY